MEVTHAATADLPGPAHAELDDAESGVVGSWSLDVRRGPNWLFVRVKGGGTDDLDLPALADRVCSVLDRHFTYRVVLELQEIELPCRSLIHQLRLLDDRIRGHDGILRLCGLTPQYTESLRRSPLTQRLPSYGDREEAVWGCRRGTQPRSATVLCPARNQVAHIEAGRLPMHRATRCLLFAVRRATGDHRFGTDRRCSFRPACR